jgi:segregation and condensation protein A
LTTPPDSYWLKQPYAVLFDILHLHRVKPWDVHLEELLTGLMKEMRGRGYIDFSVSGTALLTSAILLRMKSELLLKMEEPPKPPAERPTDYVPPPLAFPIRYQSTTTSLEEVLKGILEVLKAEKLVPVGTSQLVTRTPAVFEQADDWLVKIEEEIKAFYNQLSKASLQGSTLSFIDLLGDGDAVQAVRMFIMLLFLAFEGKVGLNQQAEFGDIEIEMKNTGSTTTD